VHVGPAQPACALLYINSTGLGSVALAGNSLSLNIKN